MYPLTARLDGVVVASQLPSQPPVKQLPAMSLLGRGASPADGGCERLQLRLHTGLPCWGALNMTGDIAAWSFADGLPHSATSRVCSVKTYHSKTLNVTGDVAAWSFADGLPRSTTSQVTVCRAPSYT